MADIEPRVIEICAGILECDTADLSPNSSPVDFEQWDSMLHLTMIMAVESDFAVSFTDKQMLSVGKIGDLVAIVKDAQGD